jgi:hypothetical protein
MKILRITPEKYKSLWEKFKGNMRIHSLERYPWETDEEYKIRWAKYLNPDMPRSLTYWTIRGPVEIVVK